jgi:hypothetical protein
MSPTLRLAIARPSLVARDLFLHEPVAGLVAVERLHHVITIAPGLWTFGIQLSTVGIGISHHVQPPQCPSLAVMRRGQQPVHDLLIRVGALVEEWVDFSRFRRQSRQVECDAPQQAFTIERFRLL